MGTNIRQAAIKCGKEAEYMSYVHNTQSDVEYGFLKGVEWAILKEDNEIEKAVMKVLFNNE